MENVWTIVSGMIEFASEYCMDKCVRTMLFGLMLMLLVFLIRLCNRSKNAEVHFYAMLLLLFAGFSGMNKLFFLPYAGWISIYLSYYMQPICGKIYFGIMTVLLMRFLWKSCRMKKRVRMLPVWEDGRLTEAISFVTEEDIFGWQKRYLERVKVYVTTEAVSPFSGGLLHPYVVMPERVLADWSGEECRIALCHELVHLKSGHIFWMVWFQLLKIYWWINPLIYLCERCLRDDMEKVCDERCVRHARVSRNTYGKAMLNMIALMQGAGVEGTLCFADRNDFRSVRERIVSLSRLNAEQFDQKQSRRRHTVFAVTAGALFVAILATSYPKYTMMSEISLYDEKLNMLDYNSDALCRAVTVSEGKVVIDQEEFKEFLTKNNISDDYVYVSFGGVMKVPGAGGGGNVVMVATADCTDVTYLVAEGLEYDIQIFWLKYLI